jgi:hypothetical protein
MAYIELIGDYLTKQKFGLKLRALVTVGGIRTSPKSKSASALPLRPKWNSADLTIRRAVCMAARASSLTI